MKTNAELTAIPTENLVEYSKQIADYLQGAINGYPATPKLVDWVKNNIDKVSGLGWNTYNGLNINRKKEDELDALLYFIKPLKLNQ